MIAWVFLTNDISARKKNGDCIDKVYSFDKDDYYINRKQRNSKKTEHWYHGTFGQSDMTLVIIGVHGWLKSGYWMQIFRLLLWMTSADKLKRRSKANIIYGELWSGLYLIIQEDDVRTEVKL